MPLKIKLMLIISIICFLALVSCGSSNNEQQADDYCADAGILLDGGQYYNDYASCMEGDYPDKELVLDVLNKYVNSAEKMAAFTDAVCRTFPEEAQSECYSGAFAMPAELLGFRNLLESHSADRSDLCYMAQETGGFVVLYMSYFTQSECGATD
jgi:hypothetical protein